MDTLPPLPLAAPHSNGVLPPPTVDSTLPPLPLPLPPDTRKAAHSDQHERELPLVSTDLVPLSYLIDRLITQSYSDLSTLLETLPSQSDQQRKQLLVDYVLHTRRQFLKLLVLTRWSAESERIRKSMNIIGFLSNQNHQLEGTIHGLTETVSGLKGARVRNYDLETSLDVLQKGNYQGLPSGVREAFEGQEKLKDDEVIETMRECEEVMRWRIKMGKEDVPKIMLNDYRIADGRVTFRLEGLWEASFVYSGTETQDPPTPSTSEEEDPTSLIAEDQSEWYLLSIKFLFKVKDQRGGNWNPTPTGPLKQHLLDLCNAQLARRPFLPSPPAPRPPPQPQPNSSDGEPSIDPILLQEHEELSASDLAQHSLDLKEARSKRRRDKPLQRAYTFLQRLALSYQLESVYSQAVQLIRSEWNACGLKVEISKERDRVRVGYWNSSDEDRNKSTTNPKPQTSAASSSPSPTGPGGSLVFSITPPPSSAPPTDPQPATLPLIPSSSSSSRLNSRRKALDSLLSRSKSSSLPLTPNPAPDYPPTTLYLSYEPPSSSSATTPQDVGQSELPSDVSLEKLLEKVTIEHARRSIQVLENELKGGGVEGVRLIREEKNKKGKGKGMDLDSDGNEDDEVEELEEEEEGVPYLLIPLVGTRAISAHIDEKSGRFELRVANTFESAVEETTKAHTEKAGEGGGEGEGASQESRLRSASDRINSLRFGGTNRAGNAVGDGDYWMKSLPDVIAKIKATTILDEISTLLTLLSLPTLRRLPLPPRELSKFGPLPSFSLGRPTFLFVPLNAYSKNEGLEGFYLAIVLMEDGVRMGLLGTRECVEESTGNSWVEINDVGWIYNEDLVEGKGKEKEVAMGEVQDRGSNFGFSLGTESLRKVWSYCVHRILLYRLEQQLHSRQISYLSSSASSRLSIGTKPPPLLILDTKGLVRLPGSTVADRTGRRTKEEGGTIMRTAALQCEFDEEANTIRTTLHIRLNPSIPITSFPPAFSTNPQPASTETPPLSTLPRNVFYNPSTRTLVFLTENGVLASLERLLRAYAGVVKELEEEIQRKRVETAQGKLELAS